MGRVPWYLPVELRPANGSGSALRPLCDGYFTAKFQSAVMDDDGSGCDCLPDCEGVSYEAHVDSRTVDAEVECGGELGSGHVALYTDPFSLVQQVMKERLTVYI